MEEMSHHLDDVDGVLDGERAVAEARTIPVISYREAAELAYFGAKVPHRNVEPVRAAAIPCGFRNILSEKPGTKNHAEGRSTEAALKR